MKKTLCFMFATLVLISNVFANTIIYKNENQELNNAIRLTPEIYRNSSNDLSNVVLLDENSIEIPYIISSFEESLNWSTQTFELFVADIFYYEADYFIDLYLKGSLEKNIVATSLVIPFQEKLFAENVSVYASFDGITWDYIKSDFIFQSDIENNLEINFTSPQDQIFYRIKFHESQNILNLDGAELLFQSQAQEKMKFLEETELVFDVSNVDDITTITIKNANNLNLESIQIFSNDFYSRTVRMAYVTDSIHNYPFGTKIYTHSEILLDGMKISDENNKIQIFNNDQVPINITKITAKYIADDLIFSDNLSKKYTLEFGVNDKKEYEYTDFITDDYSYLEAVKFVINDEFYKKDINVNIMLFSILIIAISIATYFICRNSKLIKFKK